MANCIYNVFFVYLKIHSLDIKKRSFGEYFQLDPIDAGTDNGFTFTAPNWATDPPGVVFRVTNTYPPHPAGSFHYPFLKRLPAIAFFQFVKVNTQDEIYLFSCL
jgi:Spondin_N